MESVRQWREVDRRVSNRPEDVVLFCDVCSSAARARSDRRGGPVRIHAVGQLPRVPYAGAGRHAPQPSLVLAGELWSVWCASAGACTAVGDNVVAQWDGKTWQVISAWGLTGVQLTGVSCSSGFECLAVGSYTWARTSTAGSFLSPRRCTAAAGDVSRPRPARSWAGSSRASGARRPAAALQPGRRGRAQVSPCSSSGADGAGSHKPFRSASTSASFRQVSGARPPRRA